MSDQLISSKEVSINPFTLQEHPLPGTISDSDQIRAFLAENNGKKCVVVQGLGFVGAVMSVICANALTEEYAVIGIDLPDKKNYWKIKAINEGNFPLVAEDPKIEVYYQQARKKKNLLATYDTIAYTYADIVIVDINLDVEKNSTELNDLISFNINLDLFKKAIKTIGENCKEDVLVLIETTVPPGTSEKLIYPIINECLAKRGMATDQWKLGHSYERVMPGPNYIDSIQNFYRVFSGINEESANATERFLKTIIKTETYPLTKLESMTASEMAKVLENSYRAMNISFMVEWSRFAEEAGVNLYDVVAAIKMRPTHQNMMLPGLGVGGYCLTKDPLLASWARQYFFDGDKLADSERGVIKNDKMPYLAFEYLSNFVSNYEGAKVLVLGVCYREDVGDTRSSPVEIFYNCLANKGAIISLHDPHVSFWEEKETKVETDLGVIFQDNYDIIVVGTKHSIYKNNQKLIEKIVDNKARIIYDPVGLFNDQEIVKISETKIIKVLGRGDI